MKLAHCIGCGCHDFAACVNPLSGQPCGWIAVDYTAGKGVCSECRHAMKAWDAGERLFCAPTGVEIAARTLMIEMGRILVSEAPPQPGAAAELLRAFKKSLGDGLAQFDEVEAVATGGDPLRAMLVIADWLGAIIIACRTRALNAGIPLEDMLAAHVLASVQQGTRAHSEVARLSELRRSVAEAGELQGR